MLGWLPGASKEAIAGREVADLNSTRTGSANRDGAWNWQDDFGAWMAGTNKDEILKLAQAKANDELRDSLSGRIADVETNLGTLTGKYSGVEGKTKQEILSALSQDEARIKALVQARTTKGFDVSSLDPNSSAVDILSATSKQVNANDDAVTKKADDRYDDEKEYRRLVASEGRLDRLHDKRMQNENNMMQVQLEYARLAQSDRQRTADRKDKAIMALLGGLGNLGAGFSI